MSHPKQIFFPATNTSVFRRLLLRNRTKTDFAVKLKTNYETIEIDPSQGFLHSDQILVISLRLNNPLDKATKKKIEVYCRPVSKRTYAECCRWFLAPIEMGECSNQLAQVLRIKTSTGFAPLDTVLDLPCQAIPIEAEQYPTLFISDSDTVTAQQIDSGTATAREISETEVLAMLPPDCALNTAREINGSGWNQNVFTLTHPSCGWLEQFFDSIFPPDEDEQEAIAPCTSKR